MSRQRRYRKDTEEKHQEVTEDELKKINGSKKNKKIEHTPQ